MSLGILNNISALYAQNNLNLTQNSLQNTLQQLSSGSRINSGADDAAGLAVADGLHANEAALAQSTQNATAGVGLLQTADGALSQVTNLLDRAVTLATEASNGTLTGAQISSANQEYQNILSQIGNIGSTTNFNSRDVFSSSATNIVVTDGTSGGLNTYADTVGVLNASSVGTSAGTAVQASTLTLTTTQPTSGNSQTAGTYTIAPHAKTDTLSGTLSITLGSGTTAVTKQFNIATPKTLQQVQAQLMSDSNFTTTLGLNAKLDGTNSSLIITGPKTGATIAANSLYFFGTSLTDAAAVPASMTFSTGFTADPGSHSTASMAIAGAASGDTFKGKFTIAQDGNGSPVTVNITDDATLAVTEADIRSALSGTGFALSVNTTTDGADADNPIFTFTGANGTSPVTVTQDDKTPLGDSTTDSTAAMTTPAGTPGTAPVAATKLLTPMGSAIDTFGSSASLLLQGSLNVSLANLTGAQAFAAINTAISNDQALASTGISASFDDASKILKITGPSDGSALTIASTSLTDVSSTADQYIVASSSAISSTAPTGAAAVPAGTVAFTPLDAADTLSGTLNIAVGGKTANLAIKSGTTAAALLSQIRSNASFIAAGISASQDEATGTITLTGPQNVADTLNVAGTSVVDSTPSTAGVGANFSGSELTVDTASTVLTTVTSAIADVAYQRGTIGADINELNSASNVASSEGVNLTSAEESIRATNYGQAPSDLSKYQILSQTGISALAQANSVQQEVLKLLQ